MDGQRSAAAGIFFLINNTFFMTLMFFVSGLLFGEVSSAKGACLFCATAFCGLGVPFLFAPW